MFSFFKPKHFDVKLNPDQYDIDQTYNAVTGYPFSVKREMLDWIMSLNETPTRVSDERTGAKILRFKHKENAIMCKIRFG